jgi:glutamate decarboxylase
VCWDKFAKYFDVEPRKVPIDQNTLSINVEDVEKAIDKNTICVGCIVGTTFTGAIDPIEDINDLLIEIKENKGWDIPIHVDAASGGFILPFTEPGFDWDFRLERVKSINVSGHKYGLTYAGLGWLIFRDATDLPKDLIFRVNYLGEFEDTFTLNFSRGTAMVVAQYYNILRFGKDGYTRIMQNVLNVAKGLAQQLEDLCANDSEKSNRFAILNGGERLPIVAFKHATSATYSAKYSLLELSHKLKEKGWIVPAYNLPEKAEKTEIMRIVVRENFTAEMAELLVNDIRDACNFFDKGGKTVERRHAVPEEIAYPLC